MAVEHFSEPPPDAIGLADALRRYVPSELWVAYEEARAAQRKLPRRASFATPRWDNDASETNRQGTAILRARVQAQKSYARILRALKDEIVAGRLVAYGQRNPPFGGWDRIPGPVWKSIQIKSSRLGRVEGPGFQVGGVFLVPAAVSDAPSRGRGRPSRINLVLEEAARRATSGVAKQFTAIEAEELERWFAEAYPNETPIKAKTISNSLSKAKKPIAD